MATNRERLIILAAWVFLCSAVLAEESARSGSPTPACPSLTGTWYGSFDGGYRGSWGANFMQVETQVNAAATVVVDGIGELQAYGNAVADCDGGVTTFAGRGSAGGHSGSFSGVLDPRGNSVSGTWEGAARSGTWKGERSEDGG